MKKPRFLQSAVFVWSVATAAIAAGCVALAMWRTVANPSPEAEMISPATVVTQRTIDGLEQPHAPRSDFVGSTTCAECHPQIAEAYRSHPMSHSFASVESAPAVEDYADRNSFEADAHHTYSVEKTAAGVFHHERRTDDNGQELYDQAVLVEYALGSGHRGRSYLIDRDGLLFMSPITWYSHAGRWDLSPQYKLPRHRRFERRIVDACLDCHTGRANLVQGADHRLEKPAFFEAAIGCERCHGPGGEHANLHRRGAVERNLDPIVNPATLDPAAREDVCAQCHLQGVGSYPRSGCAVGDFRPGQRLEETRIVFVAGASTTTGGSSRAISQVEQLRVSRCFQLSNGRFGCISCHDPHSRPRDLDRVAFYRQKCLTCHADRGCLVPESDRRTRQPDDSCVACHMPKSGASDVPHTAQTDHRVLRNPASQESSARPPGLPEFYDHSELRLPPLAIDYARGLWLAEQAEKRTDRELANRAYVLLSAVEKELPNDIRLLDALGTASAVRGRFDDSLTYWKRLLSIDPNREQTLETIAILLHNAGRTKEARPYYERLLQQNPWKASIWGRYSRLLGQENEWKQALAAAKKSQELDPSVAQTYLFLAEACQQVGELEQSRRYKEMFVRIQSVPKSG